MQLSAPRMPWEKCFCPFYSGANHYFGYKVHDEPCDRFRPRQVIPKAYEH